MISEADTETLFFYVERTFGGPSAVELSGTMLRKAIGLPVSQFAQELHDKKIEATSSPQIVDDDTCEPVIRENLKHQHQHQRFKAWQHSHPNSRVPNSQEYGGLLTPEQRRACNFVATKANTLIKACVAVDTQGEGQVPWGVLYEAMKKAGINLQADELEVVRRTLLDKPPTLEDPIMISEHESGFDAAKAVGVEWRAPVAYPSIVFKLRALLEVDDRTPKQSNEGDYDKSENAAPNGFRTMSHMSNEQNLHRNFDHAASGVTKAPDETQPQLEKKIDDGPHEDNGSKTHEADNCDKLDTSNTAVDEATEANHADSEPYDGYDGGGPGKLDVLARAPGGIALAFTGLEAEDPLEGKDNLQTEDDSDVKIDPRNMEGTLAYYAAKRDATHGPLPSQKRHGTVNAQGNGDAHFLDLSLHRTSAELADRNRGKRHTLPNRASKSPSRAGVMSEECNSFDSSGTYNFPRLGRNFEDDDRHPNTVSEELPLVMNHEAASHAMSEGRSETRHLQNHQGQTYRGRRHSLSENGRTVNDSREFEHAMLVKLGGQNGLGVGDEDDMNFREAVRQNAPEELAREAMRWRHRRGVALQTLAQQRAPLAGVFRRIDTKNSGVLNVAGIAELLRSPALNLALTADNYAVGNIDGALRLATELVNTANEEEARTSNELDRSVGPFIEALDYTDLVRVISLEAQATVEDDGLFKPDSVKVAAAQASIDHAEYPSTAGLASSHSGVFESNFSDHRHSAQEISPDAMDAIISAKIRGTVSNNSFTTFINHSSLHDAYSSILTRCSTFRLPQMGQRLVTFVR